MLTNSQSALPKRWDRLGSKDVHNINNFLWRFASAMETLIYFQQSVEHEISVQLCMLHNGTWESKTKGTH